MRSRANPIKVADFVSDSCALLWLFPFGSCGFDVALLPFDRDRGYSLAGITQFHREESFESLFREIQRQLQQVLPIRTVVIPASLVAMLQCSFPVTTGCPAVFSRFFVCRRFRYCQDRLPPRMPGDHSLETARPDSCPFQFPPKCWLPHSA